MSAVRARGGALPTGVVDALEALDERLFNPASWFVIDAGNQAVKGVAVPTLSTGLGLVGKGRVAAVVGRLRPGASVVDIDVPSDFGHWLAHEIAGWCQARGWWHLLRPSGGADGRHHLFCAHLTPENRDELEGYLAGLAAELKLRRGDLDLRDAVRPLSSPHRHGAVTRPKGDLRESMRELKRSFPDAPVPARVKRRAKSTSRRGRGQTAESGSVVPLPHLRRVGRDITPAWRYYLETGQAPLGDAGVRAGDRSLTEARLTLEFVWSGFDAETSWQMIREAHPKAMTKARHQGWSWWVKYVWNPAVTDAAALAPQPIAQEQAEPASPETLAAVAAAREQMHRVIWTQPVRSRPAVLLVGHHVLDRIARTGQLRVPCPERDLVLDTGITDRKTIRAALGFLAGHIGTLHKDCLSTTDKASTSFEFEIKPAMDEGGRQIPPPSSHPPPRPRGLWSILPRTAHSLWRTLLAQGGPLTVAEAAREAGLTTDRVGEVSKSTLGTTRRALVALGQAGLVRVDEQGSWVAATSPRSIGIDERAATAYDELMERISAERRAYRAGQTSTWSAARARAIKAQRAKEKAWWNSLSPADRHDRRRRLRASFDTLSISQQATLKARLAEGRAVAGISEREHHQAWVESLSPDEFLSRSLARKTRFDTLSPAEQGLAVAAWQRHRNRYGLTLQVSAPSTEHARLLPDGRDERDSAFLERQLALSLAPDRREHAG